MDRRVPGDEDRLAPDRRVVIPAQPGERGSLVLLAVLTLLPLIALAAWARFWSPASWEPGLMGAIALQAGVVGDVFRAINALGNLPIWAVLVIGMSAASWVVRGGLAAVFVALSLAADLAAFVVKVIVERARPETAAVEEFFGGDSFAFPSGHVVRAVALAAALVWVLAPPAVRFRLALLAGLVTGVVMGYARVSLGVHWPTDALGGALLGLGWFALTARFMFPPRDASGQRA